MSEQSKKQMTYADAGVDIDAGNRAVELMKESVRATYRPEVIGDLGGFGGLFALNSGKYQEPILVSGTDGVGTKLKLAFMADKHNTIGQDAVAMCVNDILVQGAEPLFFLDYIAVDVLLGLPSSGVHSNGFSLVRKICFEVMNYDMSTEIPEFGCSLGEKLLTPTRLYPKSCLPLIEKFDLHGMVHITGGGFYDNIPRILPEKCDAEINAAAWEIPVVFKKLQEWGNVPWAEMYRTFNMGVGMVLVVAPEEVDAVRSHLTSVGEPFYELGNVVAGNKKAIMKGGVFSE